MKSFKGMNDYDNESKIDKNFSFDKIYIDDSNEEEIGLYVLEVIPKVEVLSQADQIVWKYNNQSIPRVLTEGEIVEQDSIKTQPLPRGKKTIWRFIK